MKKNLLVSDKLDEACADFESILENCDFMSDSFGECTFVVNLS